jgi:hypothetical protein
MLLNFRNGASVALLIVVGFLAACPSIPTREFDDYLAQFQTAKTAAEDVILKAKVRAEAIADEPSNPDDAAVRAAKLNDRKAAMDARLDALNVVDSYNRVLTSLASGSSPKDIATNLESFSDDLSKFNVASIGDLVGAASPYLGVISQAVSLIDGYILAEQFGEVAAAGEKPVLGILQILVEDADDLVVIETEWIALKEKDPNRRQVNATVKQIRRLADTLKKDDNVTRVFTTVNGHLTRYRIKSTKRPNTPDKDGQNDIKAADLELLKVLATKVGESVDGYNAGLDRIDAYVAMITEYKNVLATTSKSLVSLNRTIVTGRRTATIDLATDVFRLRESYLALEETK